MDNQKLNAKDKLSLGLLRFFSRWSLPALQRFAGFLGALIARFKNGSQYQTVFKNLTLCFPEQTDQWRHEKTRETLIATAKTAFEFAKTWGMPTDYSVGKIRQVHGEEIFHAALAEGKGVIGIVPHWGTWEFMNAWVNQFTAPIIMYKPGKQPGVDLFVAEARGRLNASVVPTDDGGVRTLFKGLRKGAFTAILPDHIPNEQGGVFAPFFGINTWTGVMVPKLVHRTGCRVIVMGCLRREDGDGFDIYFLPGDPDIGHEDLLTATTAMNRSMEMLIRMAPEHYQWNYKRFKKNAELANPY
ncbi:MAG: lipid A biosynthesis acyltransferase [Acinetobacter sp.]|nr:lipid A biosynthesis acyltransferase [Acinetobacter sp.]